VQRYSILPKQQTYSKKNKWGESYIPALSIYNSRGKSQEDGIGEGEVKERAKNIHRLYVTATVMEVPCLTVGSILPHRWQMSANGVGRDKDSSFASSTGVQELLPFGQSKISSDSYTKVWSGVFASLRSSDNSLEHDAKYSRNYRLNSCNF